MKKIIILALLGLASCTKPEEYSPVFTDGSAAYCQMSGAFVSFDLEAEAIINGKRFRVYEPLGNNIFILPFQGIPLENNLKE